MASLRLALSALFAGALALSGCGHTPASIPQVDDAPATRLDRLVALDKRVANVAWRLAISNSDLCPVVRPRAGWTLQSAAQYGSELRPLAEARFGLDGDLPGHLAAPENSPAALAGLQTGDLIVAVNGQPLARDAGGGFDGLAYNLAILDANVARGPVDLAVRRGGQEMALRLSPALACVYPTQVEVDGKRRSRTDGRGIYISDGMANILRNEDELAFILAHELAHAVLEHRKADGVTGTRGASNWAISMRRGLSLQSESDADRMGLFLLVRAGFDPGRAIEFLTRLEEADPLMKSPQANLGGVYEGTSTRRRSLQPVLADIVERQKSGRPLIP